MWLMPIAELPNAEGIAEENPESSIVSIMQLTNKRRKFHHKEKLEEEHCGIEIETCPSDKMHFNLTKEHEEPICSRLLQDDLH
jgi:hypothetical protein